MPRTPKKPEQPTTIRFGSMEPTPPWLPKAVPGRHRITSIGSRRWLEVSKDTTPPWFNSWLVNRRRIDSYAPGDESMLQHNDSPSPHSLTPAAPRRFSEKSPTPHTRAGSTTPVAREVIDQASPASRRSRADSLPSHSHMVELSASYKVVLKAATTMEESVAQPRESLGQFGSPEREAPNEPAQSPAPSAERSPSPDARIPGDPVAPANPLTVRQQDPARELFPTTTPEPDLRLAGEAQAANQAVRAALDARKTKDMPQNPPATTDAKNPPKTKSYTKLFKIGGAILGVVVIVGAAGAAVYFIGPAAIVAAATAGLSHAAAGLLTAYHALANVMAFIGQHTAGYVFNLSPNAATAVGSVVSFIGAAAIFGAGKAAVNFVAKPKTNAPVPT